MGPGDLLILGGAEVKALLAGREPEAIETVRAAYLAHGRGQSSLPHSLFLRFPGNDRDRIIALPAYLGDGFEVAGIKWIASVPGNLARGLERASAVIIMNSPATGRPEAILEASAISARRTAASAALAGRALAGEAAPARVGLVGCGPIAFEILRHLAVVWPELSKVVVCDLDPARGRAFVERCAAELPRLSVAVEPELERLLATCPLITFATTAGTPHVESLDLCRPGTTVLHVSLRDLSAQAILAADNVVDDVDHVCRAQTSIHLAEQASGSRAFIRCTLADVLSGAAPPRRSADGVTVFSPFGLGILDLALAKMVRDRAQAEGHGTVIPDFLT